MHSSEPATMLLAGHSHTVEKESEVHKSHLLGPSTDVGTSTGLPERFSALGLAGNASAPYRSGNPVQANARTSVFAHGRQVL